MSGFSAIRGGGGGGFRRLNGKNHLKFPFWLFESLPNNASVKILTGVIMQ